MIHFLKKNSTIGQPVFIKLTPNKEIIIDGDELQFNNTEDEVIETNIGWYKENWIMTDATRQEFDDAYKKIVEKLNEIASK